MAAVPGFKPYIYQGRSKFMTRMAADAGLLPGRAPGQPSVPAVPPPAIPPQLKGAVKMDSFPERSKYPFREIANDGGVWKLDPAAFGKAKAPSIRAAATKWAAERGMHAKVVLQDGFAYVQFTAGEQ